MRYVKIKTWTDLVQTGTESQINREIEPPKDSDVPFMFSMKNYCDKIIELDNAGQVNNFERWSFESWMIQKEYTESEYPELYL